MRRMTLTFRLVLSGIAIMLVPAVCIGLLSTVKSSNAMRDLFTKEALVGARSNAEQIQMALSQELNEVRSIAMSKAAVIHMTRAMAVEWGKYGINVNAICPGYIDTEMNHHHWQTEAGQRLMQMLPRKRLGKPEDLDAMLVMLASGQSSLVNGAILTADDGLGI